MLSISKAFSSYFWLGFSSEKNGFFNVVEIFFVVYPPISFNWNSLNLF